VILCHGKPNAINRPSLMSDSEMAHHLDAAEVAPRLRANGHGRPKVFQGAHGIGGTRKVNEMGEYERRLEALAKLSKELAEAKKTPKPLTRDNGELLDPEHRQKEQQK
jgi:hypothetical protein